MHCFTEAVDWRLLWRLPAKTEHKINASLQILLLSNGQSVMNEPQQNCIHLAGLFFLCFNRATRATCRLRNNKATNNQSFCRIFIHTNTADWVRISTVWQ